jgi:hypothetical protein
MQTTTKKIMNGLTNRATHIVDSMPASDNELATLHRNQEQRK